MKPLFVSAFALLSAAVFAQIPDDVSLEPVPGVSNLNGPLGLKHAGDGSDRLFIVEQAGRVQVLDSSGNLLTAPLVDISSRVACCGERGLLDIAFHPQFATNGVFYLHYSAGSNRPAGTAEGDTIVAEFVDNGDPAAPVTAPERIILTVAQDFGNHNGGQMRFGPDGYLYLGLGDGGRGGDPCERAQTLDPADLLEPDEGTCPTTAAALDPSRALLGKMLRIDVDSSTQAAENTNLCGVGAGNAAEYAVPTENPFADQNDRCGEVLLYGLRNPWRWSFDRVTGDLWIGDVGQNQWEEIDLIPAPAEGTFEASENLGWDCYEASSSFEPAGCPGDNELTFPVLEYDHTSTGGCSVTGGYRYRGPISSLRGRYIYGDFCSGRIWFARNAGGTWQSDLFQSIGNIRSFGEDEQGDLYVYSGSTLLRFEGETDLIFADGFEQQ